MLITAFTILALIISSIFHEYAHSWVAHKLGDDTAKNAGRLTLNPIAHIDPVGSILLPLILIISKASFIIGWAKSVPYNPHNLRDSKYGDLKVTFGGPGTNFLLALMFGIIARLTPLASDLKQNLAINFFQSNNDFLLNQMHGSLTASIFTLSIIVIFINLLLMIFNLIPIPPLDGSKILMAFLPYDWQMKIHRIEPYGMIIIFFLLMFNILNFIWPLILLLFGIIAGIY